MAWQSPQSALDPALTPSAVLHDVSARTFMNRVYAWMTGGLLLTGITAWLAATNLEVFNAVIAWRMPLFIGQLVLVLVLSAASHKLPSAVAAGIFLGYSVLTGLTLSAIFFAYSLGSVAGAFFISAGMFASLSVYGLVTKKDLSAWGTFLFMGLIGIVLAGLVNMFVASAAMSFVISCAGVVVFAGLTAYDTQKLRQYHAALGKNGVIQGALTLYLDFINLFLSILRLMGRRR